MNTKEKIENWENELNNITASFISLFKDLSQEELGNKPSENQWSISEIIEHLIKTNESYFPLIAKAENSELKLPYSAKFSFFTKMIGKLILKSVSQGNKKKIKTFPVWEPDQGLNSANILNKFREHQVALIGTIKKSENLLKKNAVIHSPVNRFIVYKLDTAFDIIIEHEKRHMKQAMNIIAK